MLCCSEYYLSSFLCVFFFFPVVCLARRFSLFAQGGTLTTDFQFVFNTVHDYSPCCWLARLTAVCTCGNESVCVCAYLYSRAHVFASRCVNAWGTVCVRFLCPCLFVRINMWEREKWLFLSAVLLCEHEGKVSFSAQITARADKAAFRVGSNP